IPPAFGFSIAVFAGYRYATIGDNLGLEAMVGFGYQRFSTSFQSLAPSNALYIRELSAGDFLALQAAALQIGRAHPWVGVGGGLSLGHFQNPENPAHPDEERETLPLL